MTALNGKETEERAGDDTGKLAYVGKQFIPMCSLFFLMAFCNTILTNLGLSMLVTAPGGGAEVLPYLTLYVNLPISFAVAMVYAYLSHHMKRENLFTLVISFFILFTLAFTFYLYPQHQTLHLHTFAEALSHRLPLGLSGLVGMIRNWTFTIFYTMSELWGDVGVSLLFWGFANEVTKADHAHFLYPLFGVGANCAQMLAGLTMKLVSSRTAHFSDLFKILMNLVLMTMVAVIAVHAFIVAKMGSDHSQSRVELKNQKIKSNKSGRYKIRDHSIFETFRGGGGIVSLNNTKAMQASWNKKILMSSFYTSIERENIKDNTGIVVDKKSFKESLKTLSRCPHIKALTIMTISQSLAISIMEFLWKFHLKLTFPTPEKFSAFMGDTAAATGFVTGSLMILSPLLFNKMGWGEVARITPELLTYGGLAFFSLCISYHFYNFIGKASPAASILPMVVMCGTVLYVISRSAKFSLYKPAEEMVYIKLDAESRTKGKAAVDVVGVQVGKSVGSIMEQVLLLISGGKLLFITPVMFSVFIMILNNWKKAVTEIALTHEMKNGNSEKIESKKTAVSSNSGRNSEAIKLLAAAKPFFFKAPLNVRHAVSKRPSPEEAE